MLSVGILPTVALKKKTELQVVVLRHGLVNVLLLARALHSVAPNVRQNQPWEQLDGLFNSLHLIKGQHVQSVVPANQLSVRGV